VTDYTFTLTAHAKAHVWDAAFGAGLVSSSMSQTGRGERDSASLTQQSLSFLMVNATPPEPPVPLELVRSA
jgi:hypothetical protein